MKQLREIFTRSTLQLVGTTLVLLSYGPTVWAGAWTVPRNRWYAEYFYRVLESRKEFDAQADSHHRAKHAKFLDIRNEWKLEYGLTDWFNLLASLPYQSSHYQDDNVNLLTTGIGDIYLRTKLRVLQHPLVSSLQFSWKIPSAYNANDSPALGKGQFDFESRLQLSRSWVFRPYQAEVSVRRRHAKTGGGARPAPQAAKNREEALREAILVAELYQQGRRLARDGQDAQARPWMRAVVESDPQHAEAWRWLLNHAIAVAEGSETAQPRFMTVSAETAEPITDPSEPNPEAPKIETRYAGVAFVNLEGGFTARREEPANEFPIFLEAGFTPFKRLMLVGSIDSVISVKSTHEQKEDFAKWGVRAILNVWGDGFASVLRRGGPTINCEVGYNDIFAGRNTADGFEIFGKVGIFF